MEGVQLTLKCPINEKIQSTQIPMYKYEKHYKLSQYDQYEKYQMHSKDSN